jgi:hypothetical protein
VECIGIVHINPEISDEELQEMRSFEKSKLIQFSNPKVVSASRINNKANQWTVTVTFSGKQLPSHVELDRCLFPVREYFYPVRQCFGCWRYGHSVKQCKSAKRCATCSKTHDNDDEYNTCEAPARCVHCQGDHQSNDKKCEVHIKKAKESKEKQVSENEKDPIGEWPCFSQGVVDKQVPLDRNPGQKDGEGNDHTPAQIRKRRNPVEEEKEDEEEPLVRVLEVNVNVEEILQCAASIAIGLRPKEDMAELIASQLAKASEGGGPALRL